MQELLPGMIELVSEVGNGIVFVTVEEAQATSTLVYLDALECGQIKSFSIGTQKQHITFRRNSQIVCMIKGFGSMISITLTMMQFDLLRGCCLDSIFKRYSNPHIDLELGEYDLIFGFDSLK